MADQDFNIRVVTTADTSGIDKTTQKMGELDRAVKAAADRMGISYAEAVKKFAAPATLPSPGGPLGKPPVGEDIRGSMAFASAAGFGLISIVDQVARAIDQWSANVRRAAEEQLSLTNEISRAVESYKDIRSVEAWGNKAREIEYSINELRERRMFASEEEKKNIDAQITSRERQLTDLEAMAGLGLERAQAEEKIRLEVRDTTRQMREGYEDAQALLKPNLANATKIYETLKAQVTQERSRVEALTQQKALDQSRIENARKADQAVKDANDQLRDARNLNDDLFAQKDEAIAKANAALDAARTIASQADADARDALRDQQKINEELIKRKAILGELESEEDRARTRVRGYGLPALPGAGMTLPELLKTGGRTLEEQKRQVDLTPAQQAKAMEQWRRDQQEATYEFYEDQKYQTEKQNAQVQDAYEATTVRQDALEKQRAAEMQRRQEYQAQREAFLKSAGIGPSGDRPRTEGDVATTNQLLRQILDQFR